MSKKYIYDILEIGDTMNNFKFIMSKLKNFVFRYIIGICVLIIYVFLSIKLINILGTTIDMLMNKTIDINSINSNVNQIVKYAIAYAVLVLIWKPFIYSGAKNVKRLLHKEVYTKVCEVPYEYIATKTHGDLLSYLHNDVEYIENLLSEKIVIVLTTLATISFSIVYIAMNMPTTLTIIAISILLGAIVLLAAFTVGMTKTYEKIRTIRLKNASKIQQIVSGIKTIKRFNKVEDSISNFRKHAKILEDEEKVIINKKSRMLLMLDLYMQLAYTIILLYTGTSVLSKEITVGGFVEFTLYFSLIIVQSSKLANIFPELKQIAVSIYKVRKLLNIKTKVDSKVDVQLLGEKLTVRKLTVNPYLDEGEIKNILNNVSFEVEKGRNIGIIGRVGSGKSTLVNILSEIYAVSDNMVLIDDIDINTISQNSIKNIIEIISEDNYVFTETIYNNATFFNDKYSLEEVKEACKKTFLHKQIKKMPLKYDTIIGANGVDLTIGQRQRLRIARAFLTNKKIIIFDECFSGIDTELCDKIIQNIKDELKDKIVIIISNNINNVKWCNEILVMDEGKVIEKGKHSDLSKVEESLYSKMCLFQKKISGGV